MFEDKKGDHAHNQRCYEQLGEVGLGGGFCCVCVCRCHVTGGVTVGVTAGDH